VGLPPSGARLSGPPRLRPCTRARPEPTGSWLPMLPSATGIWRSAVSFASTSPEALGFRVDLHFDYPFACIRRSTLPVPQPPFHEPVTPPAFPILIVPRLLLSSASQNSFVRSFGWSQTPGCTYPPAAYLPTSHRYKQEPTHAVPTETDPMPLCGGNKVVQRKLVLLGDGACGKTSLLNVFTRGFFPVRAGVGTTDWRSTC
jgi:hypothetical protein